jgi:hypothetical protein
MRPAKRLAFTFIPALLLFGAAELLCRVLWEPSDVWSQIDIGTQLQPHPRRIWGLQPGTMENFGVQVTVDNHGMRQGVEQGASERWMTLGDSSIFGHGVADGDTLHFRLHAALEDRGHKVDSLCAGIPGYSILQTRIQMEEEGWDRKPTMLVVGNLWSDNNFDMFVDHEWLSVLNSPQARITTVMGRLRLWAWLNARLKPFQLEERGSPTGRISWVRDAYSAGKRRVPLGDYGRALDGLLLDAASHGAGVVVMQPANRHRLVDVNTPTMWNPYFKLQREVAERRGVPVLDAAAVLRVFGLRADDAFLDEMHPTGEANGWIAESLVDLALQKGWPKERLLPDTVPPPYGGEPLDKWAESGTFFQNVEKRKPLVPE